MPKFYFAPLLRKRKIQQEAFAAISKQGVMSLGKKALLTLGLDLKTPIYCHLYEDTQRRALGFKFETIQGQLKKGTRVIKPHCYKNTHQLTISIKPFTDTIQDIILPVSGLSIKKYSDSNMGELYYIRIPRGKEKLKEEE